MNTVFKSYVRKLLLIGGVGLLPVLLFFLQLPFKSALAILYGYMLSYIFVASSFFVVRKINLDDQKRFFKIFLWSTSLRYILILGCFVFVLIAVNIDQIFFTVSFIISYIIYSVIEIIFINKILETENENR